MENYLTYDAMYPGMEFGEVSYELTPEQVKKYIEAVEGEGGPGADAAPPTIAALFTTLRVVLREHKMPPGAIHAKQYFKFIRPVRAGEKLRITVRIADKFVKKERNWAVIESSVYNEKGEPVIIAKMSGIWPK
jgi:3-hydroxybutyryl-CoA dehydratase